MTKELQDLAWQYLPLKVKKEVKRLCKTKRNKRLNEVSPDFIYCLVYLFGKHNLTSDAEGEEMLTISRKELQKQYQMYKQLGYLTRLDALMRLFGSKCLPDEPAIKEPKPAEPKFKLGDELVWDKRIIVKVYEIYADGEYLVYSRPGNRYIVKESDLEPYTEPKDEVVKMKPIKSKVSVYLATKEEDEEFRTLLHKNGFMWSSGNDLTSRSNWDSDHKDYQVHFVYPDKTVAFLGKRTEETLTFTEFKKRYFGEDVNLSQETADCDKPDCNRLHIAAIIVAGMMTGGLPGSADKIVSDALLFADALIEQNAKKTRDRREKS